MTTENKQSDERAAFDLDAIEAAPLVDAWIRSRGTSMDGTAYAAAIELAAFVLARATTQQASKGGERAAAIREVAAYLNKKADEYALEYGSDDMGALSFGQGRHAQDKMEYHSNLLELAEEIEALTGAAAPQVDKGDEREAAKRAIGYVMAMNGPQSLIRTLHRMGEDAYVAQRMTELLAEVYGTIIGDDARPEDEALPVIERVKKAAQVLRLEVELYRAQRDEAAEHPTEQRMSDAEDAARLDWLREECCDLRSISVPTGGDDADVNWIVIQHHMAEPREREIGRGFSDDPRDAIDAARKGDSHAD